VTAVVGGDRVSKKPRPAVVAWSAGAVSVAGFATAWVLAARNRDLLDLRAEFGPDRFLVGYAVIGAVLASRRQSNPIGWLLLGIGLASAARAVAGQYALYALIGSSRPAAAVWAAWYVNWSLTLLFPGGLLTFLLLLFPSGRLLSPRWRAVGWLAAGLSVIYLLLTWLCSASITLGSGVFRVPNPTAVRGWSFAAPGSLVSNVAWVLGWVPLLAAAASLVGRYRRSVSPQRSCPMIVRGPGSGAASSRICWRSSAPLRPMPGIYSMTRWLPRHQNREQPFWTCGTRPHRPPS
jgi:hypothetical protein